MNRSRRDVLKQGAGLTALCALGPTPLMRAARAAAAKIPIGLQLYSVRNECGKDLPGVLKAVAAMGYKGVEFAGYYGRDAAALRKLLDENGLACCGTHTGWNTIQDDALKATVEFNRTLGNKYLVVPGLPKGRLETVEACKETAKILTAQAAKVKDAGMYVGYHAHGGDFKKFADGQTPWEVIFGNAGPGVIMQLDTGNCLGGGGDPIAILKKFPGRSLTIHLKEHGGPAAAAVGDGEVKWSEVFALCESTGKTEWYIVEHESGSAPMESVKACIDNLRKMGKA
jgi:sugar phosphate isomerase/epimerase